MKNTLKVARTIKGKRQMDLEQETGIHYTKISLFERFLRQPTPVEKEMISRALGLNIDDIQWTRPRRRTN